MNIVYLNGQFKKLNQAKVSVLDRGFLFGDGVYETILIYKGILFHPEKHLSRLRKHLRAIKMTSPLLQQQWLNIFHQLLKKNNVGSKSHILYLQITRGTDHAKPTIFCMLRPYKKINYKQLKTGFKVITQDDIRWDRSYIKSTSLLPTLLLRKEAKQHKANETLLIRDRYIIEGTSSNLFIVKNNIIITPPLDHHNVNGITRELLINIAKKHAISVFEKNITKKALLSADEVWITSSSRDIMPITIVYHHKINRGTFGPVWQKLSTYFEEYKKNYVSRKEN